MSMMEDRSGLFNEIQKFSQRALRKVETNVTTGLGEKVVEKRNAKGLKTLDNESNKSSKSNDTQSKLDLQVGLVIPGLMIGSQDIAHNKKVLEEYGITHIINAAENEVENKFEDDYNYYSMQIEDSSSTDLNKYLDDIYEFIDQGRFAGNCFVHCDAHKPGLSRSSAICIAYLMYKEKRRFDDAYNEVKEARPFVKPNDSFMKQLKKLDEEYNGTKKKDEIEDPFTKKKRMEIEAEKAMLKGTTSVKNKLQMFKKVEEDEKSRVTSPTPNKLRTNVVSWGTETGEDNNNNRNKDNSSEEKPTPKKLTSILSFFQPKDASSSSSSFKANNSIGLPKVVPSNGPVKKWKPVETKGLQRVKDPQIKFDPHKDFSAYERIKKSKSGVKWATKKDALKRTKSKEFKAAMAAKENQPTLPPSTPASKTTQSSEIKNNSTIKSDSISTTTTTSKTPPNVSTYKSPSNSVPPPPPPPPPVPMESSPSPSTKSTGLQSKKVETSPPVVTNQVKSVRPTLRKRPSQEDESSKQTTESQRPPLRRRPSQEVAEENVTSPSVTSSRQLRRRPSQETNDQTADVQLRPSLRRRPSQENQTELESTTKPVTPTTSAPTEPIYPWRKGRKSSEVNQDTFNNKSSATNSNITTINNHQSKPTEQESMRKQSVTFDETPAQSKPEDKPKVYGVCRPKPKNIVGGAIWTAEKKPTPKKSEEIKTEDENKKIHSSVGTSSPTLTQTPSKSNPLTSQSVEDKINSSSKQQVNQESTKIEKKKEEDKKDVKKIIIIQQEESDEDEDEEDDDEEEEEDEEETEEDSDEEEEDDEDEEDEDEEDEDEDETVQSKKSGLTRSSTAEILKLIKSKTKAEIAHSMDIIEEDEEIDVLLNELEKEGIENIDWGELGIGLNEVKDIVENAIEEEEEDAEEEEDEEGDEEEEEDEDESNNEKEKDEEEEEIANLLKNLEKEGIKEDLSDFSESGKESPISSVTIVSTARPTTPSSSLKVPSVTKSSNQVKKPHSTVNYIQKAPAIDDEEEEEDEDSCEEEVELVIEDDSD